MDQTQNRIGLKLDDYKGLPSTLCTGCGHENLNSCLIQACYDLGIPPAKLVRLSGIGCSSKSPNYIVDKSYAFNGVHGRMPTIATGVHCANHRLVLLGLSGDGDTASIGMGNFLHLIRRNMDMVYIMENNGTYGLTKGQFSPTTDRGSKNKKGRENIFPAIDCTSLAIEMGATFVARAFVMMKDQLTNLIKAAFSHRGFAFIDVLSPCVSFGNNEGSTKSYAYIRQHNQDLHEAHYVASGSKPHSDFNLEIPFPDGAKLFLKDKLSHNPLDRMAAMRLINDSHATGKILTGLLYCGESTTYDQLLHLEDQPLAELDDSKLRPTPEQFSSLIRPFA